jgi:hypothetical protein
MKEWCKYVINSHMPGKNNVSRKKLRTDIVMRK